MNMTICDKCDKCDTYMAISLRKNDACDGNTKHASRMSHTSHTSQFALDLDEIIDEIEYYGGGQE
jgi:hypothetical protein